MQEQPRLGAGAFLFRLCQTTTPRRWACHAGRSPVGACKALAAASGMGHVTAPSAPLARPHPMRLNDAINIEDLHQMAKRRLPKVAFDFIEGGLEDERGL